MVARQACHRRGWHVNPAPAQGGAAGSRLQISATQDDTGVGAGPGQGRAAADGSERNLAGVANLVEAENWSRGGEQVLVYNCGVQRLPSGNGVGRRVPSCG